MFDCCQDDLLEQFRSKQEYWVQHCDKHISTLYVLQMTTIITTITVETQSQLVREAHEEMLKTFGQEKL